MHLLSNIWSDAPLMETDWRRERWRENGRERKLINWTAMHALLARQSAAKTKSKTTVQVCPGMRQELNFIRLAIIQTQEWTAVLKKQFQFPNCTPLRRHFCVG